MQEDEKEEEEEEESDGMDEFYRREIDLMDEWKAEVEDKILPA